MSALGAKHGVPQWAAEGEVLRGLAIANGGRLAEGIALMSAGLEALRGEIGHVDAFQLVPFAELLLRAGRLEEAETALGEAATTAERSGEGLAESAMQRVEGEILCARWERLAPGASAEAAERCLCRALDTARRQNAKSLELRAAVSLARLWDRLGRRAEARGVLGEVYGWFTEGFETADLRAARTLLEAIRD